jgi:hypothetical protein
MTRNTLVLGFGVLAVAVVAIGYWFYVEQHRSGVDITIGGHGVSIRERRQAWVVLGPSGG